MFEATLRKLIKIGRLEFILPNGRSVVGGGQPQKEWHRALDVVVRLKGAATPLKMAVDPHRFVREANMNGDLVIEKGTLWDFLKQKNKKNKQNKTKPTTNKQQKHNNTHRGLQ